MSFLDHSTITVTVLGVLCWLLLPSWMIYSICRSFIDHHLIITLLIPCLLLILSSLIHHLTFCLRKFVTTSDLLRLVCAGDAEYSQMLWPVTHVCFTLEHFKIMLQQMRNIYIQNQKKKDNKRTATVNVWLSSTRKGYIHTYKEGCGMNYLSLKES